MRRTKRAVKEEFYGSIGAKDARSVREERGDEALRAFSALRLAPLPAAYHRASYLSQVKASHPDVSSGDSSGSNRIAAVTEAWETLKDAEKRRAYDEDHVADLALNAEESDFFRSGNAKMA